MENPDKTGRLELVPNVDTLIEERGSVSAANLEVISSVTHLLLEDDYENRIRAIHPDNRFGAEARPQFLADDFLELNEMLVPFYRFLASGEFVLPERLRP
jgi:hypothetical protein